MARVYVSIGSNIDRERHVAAGVAELRAEFANLACSTVYETEAVGFDGDPFYNLVVAFDTDRDIHAVAALLRAIEDRHGRTRAGPRFSARTLDLDLLLYDDAVVREDGLDVPRGEILENAFVLKPLAELAPDTAHPTEGETFAALWARFDPSKQALWPVALNP
ncbi:MAG TPA: 2-amino-4-hydroxy-6-hydroxymethyldihydropteridine diphosphokinase [Gammaproteobacteria bacterium]|nr:2-amino-4-hydroxy-6-hydroxymethyldihydropteridine diphosphokinase [Gammaproteobacteria bacterium]